MTSRLFSSSTVYFLRQLLEEFHRGEIILPRFHRPLVWNTQKRLELFDSINKGIPLGSFTIWETQAVDIQPMTEVGSILLPKASGRTPRRYLIDGEQRLMTLYLALYGAKLRRDVSLDESLEESFDIFWDLDEQAFVEHDRRTADDPFCAFPLRGIFTPRNSLRFQRQLTGEVSREKQIDYIEQIDGVVDALKECTIAVTTVVTEELALAREVFTRINSQSVPMSTAHLVNALTWQGSSSLFDAFDEVRESLEDYPHWQYEENLSNELLLLVAKRLMGYALDEDNFELLALELSSDSSIVPERLKSSLLATARFLHARGLHNPAHVPDELMIVMLANVFDDTPDPSERAANRLEDFLWFMAYTDDFDTTHRIANYRGLEPLALHLARGKSLRRTRSWQRQPLLAFDFNRARSKAFAWLLVRRMMEFDNGESADVLAECGARAFPRLRFIAPLTGLSRAGLRVLSRPEKIGQYPSMRRPNRAVDPRKLTAQMIPERALEKLRQDPPDIKGFIGLREREINQIEEERFQGILERLFPESG